MRIFFLFLVISIRATSFAQKAPAKFGEIPMEDMGMKIYPLDSSAAAVVLFDYGLAYVVHDAVTANLYQERHVRIKILKKEGLDQGSISIPLFHVGANGERLTDLKAVTYNLENGQIKESKMSKEGTFREKFNRKFNLFKFTMPDVKEGSVIEYSYKIESEFLANFPNWRFQYSIPVRLSECWAMIPVFFSFEKYVQGDVTTLSYSNERKNFKQYDVFAHHYVANDVPAFKAEAFMTSEQDYVLKLNCALARYQFFGQKEVEIMGSWDKLSKSLLEHENFGRVIRGSGFIKDQAEQITAGKTEPLEKIEAISNYIRKNFEWNGEKDYLAFDLKKVVEEKKGSSGDLNLLMGSMLNKAGIDVDMMMLSTRDHGHIRKLFPMEMQFNYVVCAVNIGDKMLLLDATEKYLPYDVLPSRCLNGQGLVISKKNFGWIDITTKAKEKTYISADFNLSDAGILDGKINYAYDGYDAQTIRKDFYAKGDKAFAKSFLSNKQWELVKNEVNDMDQPDKSAKVFYEINIDEHATSAGEVIYINPFVTSRIEENPFRSESRDYPVDYGSKIEKTYNCKITIPEGFAIEELPKSQVLVLPENSGRYVYNLVQLGNVITITSIFQINKTLFVQGEYPHLREFYSQVIAKQSEQVVLKKK